MRTKVTALTADDMVQLLPAIARQDRLQLLSAMREGRYVPRPSPQGRLLSNPLLLVQRHIHEVDMMRDKDSAALPDPLHLFLLASGDPNEMSHGVSPLCQALRAGDASSVSLLLRYLADPVQCELGHPDPIFIAIRGEFPQGVRLLLNHKANTEARQTYATMADNSGCGSMLMLQEAASKVKLHL